MTLERAQIDPGAVTDGARAFQEVSSAGVTAGEIHPQSNPSPSEREAMPTVEQKYFAASELAGLPGMPTTARRVLERAKREAWPSRARAARGGGSEYPISCLPAVTQRALAETIVSGAPAATSSSVFDAAGAHFSSDERAAELSRRFDAKPDGIKAEAKKRLEIVREYFDLLAHGVKRLAAIDVVTKKHAIAEATLGRYLGDVKGKPEHTWLFELCPKYAGRTAIADISAEAWEVLKADYLRKSPKAPTARACIERLRADPRARNWVIPSNRTLLRRLGDIPRDVRVLLREGRDAAAKLYPSQVRSRQALHALDIVNGDGYAHKKIWVQFEDGEIRRARTWVWQDVYSSKLLSFRVDKTETKELVRLSFLDMVRTYGIPRAGRSVLLDNTRAAANKDLSGGIRHRFRFKVKDEEPDGIFKLLGCELIWATPAHGQAKPVERAFGIGGLGEYVDAAPEFAGCADDNDSYNGKTKPVPVRELERVIAREIAAANARTERRAPLINGRSFDQVFEESYANITVRKATEEQLRLLMLATEPTRVHRDGTITLDAGRMVGEQRANRYWASGLVDYAGKLVAARFDPARLHEGVHVYSADGRYMGFADCLDPAGFDDQEAGRDWNRNRAAYLRATSAAAEAERRMNVREMVDGRERARNLGGAADTTIPAPKVVQPLFRDPLERPRFAAPERTDAERDELARLEADLATPATVNVLELRSDADKHAHWKALNTRRTAGEQLADVDELFWQHWQTQDYYRLAVEAEGEFNQEFDARRIA